MKKPRVTRKTMLDSVPCHELMLQDGMYVISCNRGIGTRARPLPTLEDYDRSPAWWEREDKLQEV